MEDAHDPVVLGSCNDRIGYVVGSDVFGYPGSKREE
jgi:hypothetical protein